MYAEGLTTNSPPIRTASARHAPGQPTHAIHLPGARPPVALLGVVFDNLTLIETVERIQEMILSGRSHYVVTANVDFLALARRDAELQRILLNAPLVLCDGTPLVWASRLFGNPLPERVAGADVVPELIRLAAAKHYRLFFLGTTEEACTTAVARLRAAFPKLDISHFSPPFRSLGEMDDAEIIGRIRAAKPDVLLVAFGCPKAEKWMTRHQHALRVPVLMGVGATIDFLAGRMTRAPLWMQRSGSEWIYRLGQEPRRLCKRYAKDLWFFGKAMVRQWWSMTLQGGASRSRTRTSTTFFNGVWQRVEAAGSLDKHSVQRDAAQWRAVADADRHCLLELAETKSMDSTGVAVLVHLKKHLGAAGRQLILLSPSPAVRRGLLGIGVENCFGIADDALEARAIVEAQSRAPKSEPSLEQAA